jgi:hypothetical protein
MINGAYHKSMGAFLYFAVIVIAAADASTAFMRYLFIVYAGSSWPSEMVTGGRVDLSPQI